jgi:hypothetical protein
VLRGQAGRHSSDGQGTLLLYIMYMQYNNFRLTWIFHRIIQQAGV